MASLIFVCTLLSLLILEAVEEKLRTCGLSMVFDSLLLATDGIENMLIVLLMLPMAARFLKIALGLTICIIVFFG